MRFIYVIPRGGFPLRAAIEKMDKRRPIIVLESFYYVENRPFEKTATYYEGGIEELRKISRKIPRKVGMKAQTERQKEHEGKTFGAPGRVGDRKASNRAKGAA